MAKKSEDSKLEAAALAIEQIKDKYGKNAIMRFGEAHSSSVDSVSTSSISLDIALGVGGVPRGRIIEVFGPEASGKTTLAQHIIAEVQKKDGVAAFIDAEHALDPDYAKKIGVDVKNLYISQPDTGEQALEILETLVRSNAVDIVVIDSVAALVPKAEIEGEMGASHMGLQARLMSQALRKLTGVVSKTNTIIIFINQTRHKIGVFFGCIHGHTRVPTKNGMIFMNKLKLGQKILSYSEEKDLFTYKKINKVFNNGKTKKENFIHLTTDSFERGGGKFGIILTKNHKVLTSNGWKEANTLKIGDLLVTPYTKTISNSLQDFIYGTIIGDTSIYVRKNSTACLKLQDNKNKEYIKWKINKLKPFFNIKENKKYYSSNFTSELFIIKKEILENKRSPINFLDKYFSWLGLALWIMDDGHLDLSNSHCRYSISIKRLKNDREKLNKIKTLLEKRGLNSKINFKIGKINFDKNTTLFIANKIKKYIPKCMEYKLPIKYRKKYKEFLLSTKKSQKKKSYVKLIKKEKISKRMMRDLNKYDLSVLPFENYVVGGSNSGIVVHNSPETTTGGNALKFYSSVRIEVRRSAQIKQAEKIIGNRVKVKVVKNKVAAPFKTTEFDIMYNEGISVSGDLIDTGIEHKIINKSGNSYNFGEEKLGVGREKAKLFLKENPKLMKEIKNNIWEAVKKGEAPEEEAGKPGKTEEVEKS